MAGLADFVPDPQLCDRTRAVQKVLYRQSRDVRFGAGRGAFARKQGMVRPFAQCLAQAFKRIRFIAVLSLFDCSQDFQIELLLDLATGPFNYDDIDKGTITMEVQPEGLDVTGQFAHNGETISRARLHHRDGRKEPGDIYQFLPDAGNARKANEGAQWLDCKRMNAKLTQLYPLGSWLKRTAGHLLSGMIIAENLCRKSGIGPKPGASAESLSISKRMLFLEDGIVLSRQPSEVLCIKSD